ncbi:MAG: class I SAM-dependent methyltransferase [Candidatus Korobacteraceae bacterium]
MRSATHFLKFLAGLEAPASQVTHRELDMLVRYASGARVICEIGCFEGRTSVELATRCGAEVYSVDPFFKGRLGICYGEWISRIYRKRKRADNLNFRKGLSTDVAVRFDKKLDFVFIDADHRYEAIKADWNAWVPKLRTGGIVALHDCKQAGNSSLRMGSMKFYEEDIPAMGGVRELDSVDSLVVLQVTQ